ncbi:PIN domain-containing protein [Xanthobacter autotrophicus]|uniref:PIN domain-containing protein n=1 Tax=Xanthobacter autotrophicus TaxID=280 RepID=UPI003729E08C
MRKRFSWYLTATDQIDNVWNNGILTLDANVILDLYRYHDQTREILLKTIESWAGRIWLSNQAAEEFFRNRKRVIASSEKTFKEAISTIENTQKHIVGVIESLRGNRIVPRAIIDKLGKAVASPLQEAVTEIEKSRDGHPNYLSDDPILDRLLKLFDGSTGAPWDAAQHAAYVEIAEKRMKDQIPPGYKDGHKDGERPYGDFMLWQQTMDFAKEKAKPVILVTSERKEDWWEKHSNRRVGPRLELLKESWELSAQSFLIYQTDHFLELASTRSGGQVDEQSVEEIREVSAQRAKRRAALNPAVEVKQTVIKSDPTNNQGLLHINLLRPIPTLTGSGRLTPNMFMPPALRLTLIDHPADLGEYRLNGSTGTVFDFNVHISTTNWGALPLGEYVVAYEANCKTEGGDEAATLSEDAEKG